MSLASRISVWPGAARRALAILMLVVLLALIWVMVLIPARSLSLSQERWRAAMERQIAEDRGMVSTGDEVRAARASLEASPWRSRLLTGNGARSPVDQLQESLSAALRRAGVEPTNFKVLPAGEFRELRVHRVEFASIMTVDQLQAYFGVLREQPHTVRIERLKLEAPAVQRPDENPRITVLMEAHGYSLSPSPDIRSVAHVR